MLSSIEPPACALPVDELQPPAVLALTSRVAGGESLSDAMHAVVRALGFEHFNLATGPRMKPNQASPKYIWTNVATAWLRDYDRKAYIEIDPRVDYFLATGRPYVWDQASAGKRKRVRRFMEDAAAYGIASGVTLRIPDADRFVMFVLSTSEEILSASRRRDMAHVLGDVFMLGMYVQEQVLADRLRLCLPAPALLQALSAREHECLHLAARGLKAKAIGRTLGISHRTVHYYMDNVRAKLDATNREEAVAKATAMNLLDPA